MRRVVREGKSIRTEHLELRAAASLLAHPRVGFIVPKHKHSAVERNRLKRRLREVARKDLLSALPCVDLVVRTRPEAYRMSFVDLAAQLNKGLERVKAYHGDEPCGQH